MNDERFEELAGRVLDGELSPAEEVELTTELRASDARRRQLRQHLVLWELWAQQLTPERSADAFLAAWRTRRHAERHGEEFVAQLHDRLAEPAASSGWARIGAWWRAAHRPARIACAAATAAAVVLLAAGLWLVQSPARASATTVRGEAVCAGCQLHLTHDHTPVIRVGSGADSKLYYVSSDPHAIERIGNYCMAPVPLVATGRTGLKDGRLEISVESVRPTAGDHRPGR